MANHPLELKLTPAQKQSVLDSFNSAGSINGGARLLGMDRMTFKRWLRHAQEVPEASSAPLEKAGYDIDRPEMTDKEAWDEHADAFEHRISHILRNHWKPIKRPAGAFVIYHTTDEHMDDDGAPLRLIEADIKAANDLGAVKVHGGDCLNSWPSGGRLAALWAEQSCTRDKGIKRLRHFMSMLQPDVWTLGNHDAFSEYLKYIIKELAPKETLIENWTAQFKVVTPNREFRAICSHKFQKGSSWFHPHHGFLRELLEGEAADLYLEGHLHVAGSMYRILPERGICALGVCSGGYKIVDKFATRISRGGKIPKLTGRAHWIVCDDQAEPGTRATFAFDDPRHAETMLNGLQNLRAA